LVLTGLIALYMEFSAPGIGAGGLIAGLCAVLFFWSRFFAGTAGWLEVILFAAGIIFLLMEIFVIPGFGVSGVCGLALLFSSIVLASQNFAVPQTPQQWDQTLTTSVMILCSGFVFLIAATFISKRLGAIPLFNRLVLDVPPRQLGFESTKDADGKPLPSPHPSVSVGDWGVSESLLRPAGRAKFAHRSFDVISDGSFVEPGTQVTVIRINGNVITVAPVEDAET
jgi:membrane-bound serine protease (ClpP class)